MNTNALNAAPAPHPLKFAALLALIITVAFAAIPFLTPFTPVVSALAVVLGVAGLRHAPWWGYRVLIWVAIALGLFGIAVGILLGTHVTATFG